MGGMNFYSDKNGAMKLAPSLQQAYIRRHWLLATGILENILFSAVLLGWPALVSVLKNEGYYAQLCTGNWERSLGMTREVSRNLSDPKAHTLASPLAWSDGPPPTTPGCCPEMSSCPAQEKKLNLCFTVGCFMLSALTLPICVASDKFSVKWMRVIGGCLVSVSAVLFACSSAESPNILFFTCALNGIGGNVVAYTSLQISNLFGPSRILTLGLLVGSYAAAAIVFPTMKVLYALGMSLQMLFISMAILSLGIVINAWVNLPLEPILQNVDLTRAAETKSPTLSGDTGEKESCSPQSDMGVRLTEPVEDFVMPLHRVVFMPLYVWSIIIISITQLRLLFFVGDLQQLLVQMTPDNPETVDLYIFIFGILQICCLGTTHFIGGFVDWRSKKTNSADEDTHLLGRPITRTTKPIPPSSTTTSFLAEKAEASETVATNPAVPEADSFLPSAVPDKLPVPERGGVSATGMSESSFNVRKTSLVHLVHTNQEIEGQRESQTMTVLPSPEKRQPPKPTKGGSALQSGAKDLERKIQRLQDCAVVFFVTSTLTVIFGLLVLIPALTIQISTFVCYTLIRGFVPCVVGRLYGVAFHAVHHQALIGLAFLVSALFSVAQHPLFALVVDYYQGDPYWVNVGLLFVSLLSFGLPIHLMLHCQHLEEWRKATAGPPQPVLIKMQYLDTKLTSRGTPAEL